MVKTHVIKFRVSDMQQQRIRRNAERKGHKTVSTYLRSLALDHDQHRDQWLERMLLDIHKKVHDESDD